MGYSVFPQAGASSTPALRHTVNTSQTITTNNSGGFAGYAMAIGGGQAGGTGTNFVNNGGSGGAGGAGAALRMGPIMSPNADITVVVGAGGASNGAVGGTSEVSGLRAYGGSNNLTGHVWGNSNIQIAPQGSSGGNGASNDGNTLNSYPNVGGSAGGNTEFPAAGGGGGAGGFAWSYGYQNGRVGGTGSPLTGNGGDGGGTKGSGTAGNAPGGGGGGGGSAQYQNPGGGAGGAGGDGRVWIFY